MRGWSSPLVSVTMERKLLFSSIVCLLAFSLIVCGDESSGDPTSPPGGGSIPIELVARWYFTQANADVNSSYDFAHEFLSDGTWLVVGNTAGRISVSGSSVTFMNSSGQTMITAQYVIVGTELIFSSIVHIFPIFGPSPIEGPFYKKSE